MELIKILKTAWNIIAVFLSLCFVFETHAETNTIRLICKYSQTIDDDGKKSATSGEDFFTVKFSSDGNAIIRKQGLGAEFRGKISDEEIYGETVYEIPGNKIQETLSINRYTGAFEITFEIIGKKGGLINYGTCEPVKKNKF